MNISTETREILRNYRAVINARRRELTSSPPSHFVTQEGIPISG